jgi:hypothetical protein
VSDNMLHKTSDGLAEDSMPGNITGVKGSGPRKGRPTNELKSIPTTEGKSAEKPPGFESHPFTKLFKE